MIKVKLSPVSRRSLTLIQYAVEALLTDNLHTTVWLSVSCVLVQGSDDLLTHCRLAQHQQQQFYSRDMDCALNAVPLANK